MCNFGVPTHIDFVGDVGALCGLMQNLAATHTRQCSVY